MKNAKLFISLSLITIASLMFGACQSGGNTKNSLVSSKSDLNTATAVNFPSQANFSNRNLNYNQPNQLPTPYILNGEASSLSSEPFLLGIGKRGTGPNPNQFTYGVCTASIISHNYILTAAHCVENMSLSDIKIYRGENTPELPMWNIDAIEKIIPTTRTLNCRTESFVRQNREQCASFDFALVKVKLPDCNSSLLPIALSNSQDQFMFPPLSGFYISGWRRTNAMEITGVIKKQKLLPIIDNQFNHTILADPRKTLAVSFNKALFRAEDMTDRLVTQGGDSGSPIWKKNENLHERKEQVAIHSGLRTGGGLPIAAGIAHPEVRSWIMEKSNLVDPVINFSEQNSTITMNLANTYWYQPNLASYRNQGSMQIYLQYNQGVSLRIDDVTVDQNHILTGRLNADALKAIMSSEGVVDVYVEWHFNDYKLVEKTQISVPRPSRLQSAVLNIKKAFFGEYFCERSSLSNLPPLPNTGKCTLNISSPTNEFTAIDLPLSDRMLGIETYNYISIDLPQAILNVIQTYAAVNYAMHVDKPRTEFRKRSIVTDTTKSATTMIYNGIIKGNSCRDPKNQLMSCLDYITNINFTESGNLEFGLNYKQYLTYDLINRSVIGDEKTHFVQDLTSSLVNADAMTTGKNSYYYIKDGSMFQYNKDTPPTAPLFKVDQTAKTMFISNQGAYPDSSKLFVIDNANITIYDQVSSGMWNTHNSIRIGDYFGINDDLSGRIRHAFTRFGSKYVYLVFDARNGSSLEYAVFSYHNPNGGSVMMMLDGYPRDIKYLLDDVRQLDGMKQPLKSITWYARPGLPNIELINQTDQDDPATVPIDYINDCGWRGIPLSIIKKGNYKFELSNDILNIVKSHDDENDNTLVDLEINKTGPTELKIIEKDTNILLKKIRFMITPSIERLNRIEAKSITTGMYYIKSQGLNKYLASSTAAFEDFTKDRANDFRWIVRYDKKKNAVVFLNPTKLDNGGFFSQDGFWRNVIRKTINLIGYIFDLRGFLGQFEQFDNVISQMALGAISYTDLQLINTRLTDEHHWLLKPTGDGKSYYVENKRYRGAVLSPLASINLGFDSVYELSTDYFDQYDKNQQFILEPVTAINANKIAQTSQALAIQLGTNQRIKQQIEINGKLSNPELSNLMVNRIINHDLDLAGVTETVNGLAADLEKQQYPWGLYQIRPANNLQLSLDSNFKLINYADNPKALNQLWEIEALPLSDGSYHIKQLDNYDFDEVFLSHAFFENKLIMFNKGSPNGTIQRWKIEAVNEGGNAVVIRNVYDSNQVLEMNDSGSVVLGQFISGNAKQQFILTKQRGLTDLVNNTRLVDYGQYHIASKMDSNTIIDKTGKIDRLSNDNESYIWSIEYDHWHEAYAIRLNDHTSQNLYLTYRGAQNNTYISSMQAADILTQRWQFDPVYEDGQIFFIIRSMKNPQQVLDIRHSNLMVGNHIITYPVTNNANQKFILRSKPFSDNQRRVLLVILDDVRADKFKQFTRELLKNDKNDPNLRAFNQLSKDSYVNYQLYAGGSLAQLATNKGSRDIMPNTANILTGTYQDQHRVGFQSSSNLMVFSIFDYVRNSVDPRREIPIVDLTSSPQTVAFTPETFYFESDQSRIDAYGRLLDNTREVPIFSAISLSSKFNNIDVAETTAKQIGGIATKIDKLRSLGQNWMIVITTAKGDGSNDWEQQQAFVQIHNPNNPDYPTGENKSFQGQAAIAPTILDFLEVDYNHSLLKSRRINHPDLDKGSLYFKLDKKGEVMPSYPRVVNGRQYSDFGDHDYFDLISRLDNNEITAAFMSPDLKKYHFLGINPYRAKVVVANPEAKSPEYHSLTHLFGDEAKFLDQVVYSSINYYEMYWVDKTQDSYIKLEINDSDMSITQEPRSNAGNWPQFVYNSIKKGFPVFSLNKRIYAFNLENMTYGACTGWCSSEHDLGDIRSINNDTWPGFELFARDVSFVISAPANDGFETYVFTKPIKYDSNELQ